VHRSDCRGGGIEEDKGEGGDRRPHGFVLYIYIGNIDGGNRLWSLLVCLFRIILGACKMIDPSNLSIILESSSGSPERSRVDNRTFISRHIPFFFEPDSILHKQQPPGDQLRRGGSFGV
jgi:hypothetical protein